MSRVITLLIAIVAGYYGFDYLDQEFEIRSLVVPADYVFAPNEFSSREELALYEAAKLEEDVDAQRSLYENLIEINQQKPFYREKLESLTIALHDGQSSEIYKSIEASIDSAIIQRMNPINIVKSKYEAEHQYLRAAEEYNVLPEQNVYLYYDGLASGSIWDAPGARAFGASMIATISFANGPQPAKVIAHSSLEGDRNYFYVMTESAEGWMGRPYIRRDRAGSEFLMPNPITGETVQTELKIPLDSLISEFRTTPSRYVPSYDSIQWDSRIPERFRREGYSLYLDALNDGYSKVDSLVRQYQSTYSGW